MQISLNVRYNKFMIRILSVMVAVLGISSVALAEGTVGVPATVVYNAHMLFRVGNCEVWGLTYKNDNFVVSVCPTQTEKK